MRAKCVFSHSVLVHNYRNEQQVIQCAFCVIYIEELLYCLNETIYIFQTKTQFD